MLLVGAVAACSSPTTSSLNDDITTVAHDGSVATTSSSAPAASTTTPPTTSTSTAPTTTTPRPGPVSLVDQLRVEPEHLPGYDRDLFKHWSDVDRNGCNTRCEVLAAERRPDVGWVSIYDGFVTNDASMIEIDHVVALAEAWRSGAWAWDDARREAFANDLDEPAALIAVSSASNQSKADKDPAEWRPRLEAAWCQWATGWTQVKVKWDLSADVAEVKALRVILSEC